MTTAKEDVELLDLLNQTKQQIEQFRVAASSAERLENARAIRRAAEEYRRRSQQLHVADHVSMTEHVTVTKTTTADDTAST